MATTRRAGPPDLDDVVRLIGGFRDFYGGGGPTDEMLRAGAERLLVPDGDAEFFLAGEPAGAICQVRYRWSMWTGTDDAWIEDVFVEEAARGWGLGRAVVEAAIVGARKRGCVRVQLDANERNAAALALYESLGFEHAHAADWDGGRDLYFTLALG